MRCSASIEISAPDTAIWAIVSDPARYLEFMSGVTRWETASKQTTGVGARYRMLILVGSAEVGGLIEVVESHEARDLAWTSVTGVDQRGRWRLREHRPGRTRVELRLSYGVAGSGLTGWLSERLSRPIVEGHLRRSLHQLKRLVEHEQHRERVANRRARRVTTSA
jgi:uncharacterized membrane protein